jgi:hypothetical protein
MMTPWLSWLLALVLVGSLVWSLAVLGHVWRLW